MRTLPVNERVNGGSTYVALFDSPYTGLSSDSGPGKPARAVASPRTKRPLNSRSPVK